MFDALKDRLAESERILAYIRAAASKTSVAKHARVFMVETRWHRNASKVWLKATNIMAAVTGAMAFGLLGLYLCLYFAGSSPSGAQGFQLGVASLAILSVFYFVLLWCSRMYRAHVHNATMNKHRANALQTFEAFVEGATDEQTKNAVLIQAAQSIFSPQSTGFSPGKESDHAGGPHILEIVRSVMASEK